MDRKLTIRMSADLATKLERVARRTWRKRSDIVRLALEQFLDDASVRTRLLPVDLVRDLLGSVGSGVPELGQAHRDYLLRRLPHAR